MGVLSLADPSAPHGPLRRENLRPRTCPRVAPTPLPSPGLHPPPARGGRGASRHPGAGAGGAEAGSGKAGPGRSVPGRPCPGRGRPGSGTCGRGGRGSGGSYLEHGADVRAGLGAGAATPRPGRGVPARDQVRSMPPGPGRWAPGRRPSHASVSPPAQRMRARAESEWGPGRPAAGRAGCAPARSPRPPAPGPSGAAGRSGPAPWWPRAAARGAWARVSLGDPPAPPPGSRFGPPEALRAAWGVITPIRSSVPSLRTVI